jgi:hypothetical protein
MAKATDKNKDTTEDKDKKVEIQDKITGETREVSPDKAEDIDRGSERVVTDTDRLAGTVLATGRDTRESEVDMNTLDSPRSAKGPQADEIPAPREDTGDVATANLSTEAQREGKRVGVGGRNEKMIAALLREREGLAASGKGDRVAQIDEQLQHYGHDPKVESRSRTPQGRTGSDPGQKTA